MPRPTTRRLFATASGLLGALLIAGCFDDDTPVRLGFIGGMTGSNADFGLSGRNGAMLAVEEANRAGGINGRPIELVIRDDGNAWDTAVVAARDLTEKEKVAAIIGPFTSAMSEAVRTVTESRKMLVFSPTASSDRFLGQDDYFFRLCFSASVDGEYYADFMAVRRGYKRVSLAVDKTNPSFTKPYVEAFKRKFQSHGGETAAEIWEDFRTLVGFDGLVERLRAPKPDAIFIVTNAVDAARIAQQVRKVDTTTKIVVTEWAGTQQLIELGGKAVEGVEILQLFNRFDKEERFLRFAAAYRQRFTVDPSFSSVLTYEVTQVLIDALTKRKEGETLKAAILANRPYQGLQQALKIDDYGDSQRESHFVVIKGTEFAPAP